MALTADEIIANLMVSEETKGLLKEFAKGKLTVNEVKKGAHKEEHGALSDAMIDIAAVNNL